MKFSAGVTLGLLASVAKTLAQSAGNLIIQSPASIVECQPSLISFSGGAAPYFLSVLPGGQASAAPILLLPDQPAAGSYTWNVNLPAGSYITLQIRDSTGLINYSSPLTVLAGTDQSCIDQAAASSASSVGATTAVASGSSAAATSGSAVSSAPASSTLVSSAASNTVTAASGIPTNTANVTDDEMSSNFTCSEGLLTYGISTVELDGVSLEEATAFFSNLTASQPTATNVTGQGVGAEVMFMVGNLSYQFTLITNETDEETGSLRQQFNYSSTSPLQLGNGTVLYDAFEDINVYTNETSNATSVQYFILGCFNDQPAGLTTLSSLISAAVSYWSENAGGSSTSTSSVASAASSAVASVVPSAARRLVKLF